MDLSKIKERLDALTQQNKKGGNKRIWKPTPGSHVVRIVPYIHNRDWPFLELYFYYDLAKRTIISPSNFGLPDPVLEFVDKLKSTGEREDFLLARKLEPKMRTFVPILVRGRESEGVFFWGFAKTVYEELLKTIDDPDYGDITDLKNGTDLTIDFEKPKDGGLPTTSFRMKRQASPATTDPDVIKMIKEMPTIDELWEVPSYDELAGLLDKFINNDGVEEAPAEAAPAAAAAGTEAEPDDLPWPKEEDAPAPAPRPTAIAGKAKAEPKTAAKATSDIDAAFDDMFN